MAPVTISGWERVVDVTQPSLFYAIAAILWNPLWWNLTARNEHRNKTITRVLGGNRKLGCYGLAAAIFSLGMVRDTL
jgi:phosphatidylethanolamine N-methyltransferase